MVASLLVCGQGCIFALARSGRNAAPGHESMTSGVMEAGYALGYNACMENKTPAAVGAMLREWRIVRRLSQLDLALQADISSRHLSYVETGKAQPSRDMIARLSETLEVPLRQRNALLMAGGFVFYVRAEKKIDLANDVRQRSTFLASELRQSSDELTRMARSFAATGEPVYKQHFEQILAVRDGRLPRSAKHPDIYWDLVPAGAGFELTKEANFAISPGDLGRFRVSAFVQMSAVGMVLRTINSAIPKLEELGLPEVLKDVVMSKRGLVIMVGATGSGKSTTLAAMVNHLNENEYGHILTIEDPIEFVHDSKKCLINQREVGRQVAHEVLVVTEARCHREAQEVRLVEEADRGEAVVDAPYAQGGGESRRSELVVPPQVAHVQRGQVRV
eukprot:gene24379-27575_t